MLGRYRVTIGEEVIVAKNVITDRGREGILQSIAQDKKWASSMAIGVGSTAASTSDTSLDFLTLGTDINATIVVPSEDKVYFKASLPEENQFKFTEIGCYGSPFASLTNPREGVGPVVALFNSQANWLDIVGTSALSSANARVSSESLSYSLAASATGKGTLEIDLDYLALPVATLFKFAYYCDNIADVIVRFKNDDSNYYSSDTLPVTNGYNVGSFTKGSMTATGSPSWETIKFIELESIATGSPGTFMIDAFRYDIPNSSEESLLSRVVLPAPKVKLAGVTMDIEYAWEIN